MASVIVPIASIIEERLDEFSQYPLDIVLDNLQLDVSAMTGNRVLDLGCGVTANLVKHLREHGIDAEGLGSEFEESALDGGPGGPLSFLMKAEASSIPRPDRHYGMVISHYSAFIPGTVQYASKLIIEVKKHVPHKDRTTDVRELYEQQPILQEALRVLDHGGQLVIVPLPDYLLEKARPLLREMGVSREIQHISSAMAKVIAQQDRTGYEALYRLVLTKPEPKT